MRCRASTWISGRMTARRSWILRAGSRSCLQIEASRTNGTCSPGGMKKLIGRAMWRPTCAGMLTAGRAERLVEPPKGWQSPAGLVERPCYNFLVSLTLEEVEHIADLARLLLTEEEKEHYREQLSAILDYF